MINIPERLPFQHHISADSPAAPIFHRFVDAPTTLSSVKPPFLWCVSGITTIQKATRISFADVTKNDVPLVSVHYRTTSICGSHHANAT